MCDYSLEHVQSRPAKVGDRLVSTMFGNSFTRGFAAADQQRVAVCLAPGTELAFDRDAECDHPLGFFPSRKLGERTARFRHINPDRQHEHHDALEFPSGRIVLVTRLRPGQTVTVLQLPATQTVSDTLEEQPATEQPMTRHEPTRHQPVTFP